MKVLPVLFNTLFLLCKIFRLHAKAGAKFFRAEGGEGHRGLFALPPAGDIQQILNSPVGKDGVTDDGYLRKSAIKAKVPYMTTVAAAKATAEGIHYVKTHKDSELKSLQELHSEIHDK